MNGFSVVKKNTDLFHIMLPDNKTFIKQFKSFKDVLMFVFDDEALKILSKFNQQNKVKKERSKLK